MNGPSKTPAYNLKVVIRETGLKADTLRAWERRYGLPNPQRTPGGHRLYSQYDIEMIKWLIERQKEGLRINRAVQLWQSFKQQDQDPLQMMPKSGTRQPATGGELLSGVTLDEIREQWILPVIQWKPSVWKFCAMGFPRLESYGTRGGALSSKSISPLPWPSAVLTRYWRQPRLPLGGGKS
jgi:DNA-binding transcriptional MerR regulator